MDGPIRSRQELHRELQELLAASRPAQHTLSSSNVQLHAQQSGEPAGSPATAHAEQNGSERNSSERLRLSNERQPRTRKRSSEQRTASNEQLPLAQSAALPAGAGESFNLPKPLRPAYKEPGSDQDAPGSRSKRVCCSWLPVRAVAAALRRHPAIWIIPLLVTCLLVTGGIIGVMYTAANVTTQRRQAAEGFAINAAVAFERQLNQMFGPLASLATVIRFNPDYLFVNSTFDGIAADLLEQMPMQGAVTTLIAAPQGVLRNFYPMQGYCQDNCDKININLFARADRREVALATVASGNLTMQGPMRLSQGYWGVVGRLPIFVAAAGGSESFGAPDPPPANCTPCWTPERGQFWGFVNAVVNLEGVVQGTDSRLRDLAAIGYRYRLTAEPEGGELLDIARSAELPAEPVTTDVHVPQSVWLLQVSPEAGWVPGWRSPILAAVVFISLLIGLLLGAILVSSRLQAWLKSANDALAQEQTRMDVLLARQYNLISCVLQSEGAEGARGRGSTSMEHATLARIEHMRREIGVTTGTNGVDELQLIELMDEGTYGKVFKGLWRGSMVAVKTMVLPAKMSGQEKRERMAIMEAAISASMQHPNIVQTFTYLIKPCSQSAACTYGSSEGGSSSLVNANEVVASLAGLEAPEAAAPSVHNFEVSLVLEFCDWGSLRTALDAGAFFAEDNSLNYAAILDCAADVARAMVHLHSNQVLHSDLKARNVLLKSDASGRGCIAKVADFGLAVRLDTTVDTHVTAFQGTMSHMAPEALLHGRVSKAGDVYSFGISLWELYTGGVAYQGIPRALVGHKVAVLGLRPTLPPFTPPEFRALVEDCWAQAPEQRPPFQHVLARLLAMRAALGVSPTPPLQRYKLRPKQAPEKRHSSEVNPKHLADAQDAGLVQLASFYLNSHSTTGAGPGLPSYAPGAGRTMGRTLGTGASQLERISDTELEGECSGEGSSSASSSRGGGGGARQLAPARGLQAVCTSAGVRGCDPAAGLAADVRRSQGLPCTADIEQGL